MKCRLKTVQNMSLLRSFRNPHMAGCVHPVQTELKEVFCRPTGNFFYTDEYNFFIYSLCVNLLSPNEVVGFHLKHCTVSACLLERKRRNVPFELCLQKPDLNWI
jgi:hypothetical protein